MGVKIAIKLIFLFCEKQMTQLFLAIEGKRNPSISLFLIPLVSTNTIQQHITNEEITF
jgi:hypothetical protein